MIYPSLCVFVFFNLQDITLYLFRNIQHKIHTLLDELLYPNYIVLKIKSKKVNPILGFCSSSVSYQHAQPQLFDTKTATANKFDFNLRQPLKTNNLRLNTIIALCFFLLFVTKTLVNTSSIDEGFCLEQQNQSTLIRLQLLEVTLSNIYEYNYTDAITLSIQQIV